MNTEDKRKLLMIARDKLKLALFHADAMVNGHLTIAASSTLWTLTTEAHGRVMAFNSAMGENDAPKSG